MVKPNPRQYVARISQLPGVEVWFQVREGGGSVGREGEGGRASGVPGRGGRNCPPAHPPHTLQPPLNTLQPTHTASD